MNGWEAFVLAMFVMSPCLSYLHVDNKIIKTKEKRKVFREERKKTKDGQIEAEIALDAVSIHNVFSLSIEFEILSTSCVLSESPENSLKLVDDL